MRVLILTQGQHTVVADDTFEWASKFKWYARRSCDTFYAVRKVLLPSGKWTVRQLHREILGALPGDFVDHWDGDGLHNLPENIRLCSRAENARNRSKQNSASGYKGVALYATRRSFRWRARIYVDNAPILLGTFRTAIEAARAYDCAAIELHGEFARLNFPC